MLLSLLKELDGHEVNVIDDGSDYQPFEMQNYCTYYRYRHGGKREFWKQWQRAIELCKKSDAEFFIFLPDDVRNIDVEAIKRDYRSGTCLRVLEVGRDRGWTRKGYVDGAFACDREVLDQIEIKPVPRYRFNDPYISSGVGQQMSKLFAEKGIEMIKGNYCIHGDHESVMNPEERKRNPLSNEPRKF